MKIKILLNFQGKYSKKNFFSWNFIFVSLKLFPSTKIDFWPFLKLQKVEFDKKKSWNCIFDNFELFPSSKIDFWPFLKLQKMELGQKKNRVIDLFDLTSFLALSFFNFLAHALCTLKNHHKLPRFSYDTFLHK